MMDLLDHLERHADHHGEAPALTIGAATLTWKALRLGARSVAQSLRDDGVSTGDRVVVALPPLEYVTAAVAAMYAGAIAVPVDPRHTPTEVARLCDAVQPVRVLACEATLRSFAKVDVRVLHWSVHDRDAPRPSDRPSLDLECLAHFSSGSTGAPKAILRSRLNLSTEGVAVAQALELTDADVLLCMTPVQHSFAWGMFTSAVVVGAHSILLDTFAPARASALIAERHVSVLSGTPYIFAAMVKGCADAASFASLRYCVCGGAHVPLSLATAAQSYFGKPITQEYGLSEGGIVSFNVRHATDLPGSVGQPIPGVSLTITAPDGARLGPHQVGMIRVARAGMPTAYFNAPDTSAASFPASGTTVTGDLGFVDEQGNLFIVGREKQMINVAGNKVSPPEVVDVLLRSALVSEAAVVGRPDPGLGEIVVAFGVRSDATPSAPQSATEAVLAHCRAHLAPYKVPRRFLWMDSLPRLANGKVDVKALEILQL